METVRCYGGIKLSVELPVPGVPIQEVPPPKRVILPLSDRPGVFCRPMVERGEIIFKGEKIAEDPNNRMLPIHSPVSGSVTDITDYRFAEGGNTLSLFIDSDGAGSWKTDLTPIESFEDVAPAQLISVIRDAGVKIIPFETLPVAERSGVRVTPVEHFVINGIGQGFAGAITRRLLVERAGDLRDGARLIHAIFNPRKVYLVVDAGHEDAVRAVSAAGMDDVLETVPVEVFYPLGHPHLTFKKLFHKEIPQPGGKAIDMKTAFAGVDTILHALEAVVSGRPLIERYVTVSGAGIESPKNLKALLGTPLRDLVNLCGGFGSAPGRLVLGNPLSGTAQFSLDRPVLKDTRWIWVQPKSHVNKQRYRPCINCGACVDACPVRLMPNFLGRYCEFMRFDEAVSQFDLWTCIDCGLCAHVCPSRIPLVQWINYGKRELRLREKQDGKD